MNNNSYNKILLILFLTLSFFSAKADDHKDAFGEGSQLSEAGYPDNGSGRYSKKLSYKEWFDFNDSEDE